MFVCRGTAGPIRSAGTSPLLLRASCGVPATRVGQPRRRRTSARLHALTAERTHRESRSRGPRGHDQVPAREPRKGRSDRLARDAESRTGASCEQSHRCRPIGRQRPTRHPPRRPTARPRSPRFGSRVRARPSATRLGTSRLAPQRRQTGTHDHGAAGKQGRCRRIVVELLLLRLRRATVCRSRPYVRRALRYHAAPHDQPRASRRPPPSHVRWPSRRPTISWTIVSGRALRGTIGNYCRVDRRRCCAQSRRCSARGHLSALVSGLVTCTPARGGVRLPAGVLHNQPKPVPLSDAQRGVADAFSTSPGELEDSAARHCCVDAKRFLRGLSAVNSPERAYAKYTEANRARATLREVAYSSTLSRPITLTACLSHPPPRILVCAAPASATRRCPPTPDRRRTGRGPARGQPPARAAQNFRDAAFQISARSSRYGASLRAAATKPSIFYPDPRHSEDVLCSLAMRGLFLTEESPTAGPCLISRSPRHDAPRDGTLQVTRMPVHPLYYDRSDRRLADSLPETSKFGGTCWSSRRRGTAIH